MERRFLSEAIGLLEQSNSGLSSELRSRAEAEALLQLYVRAEKLAAFGKATLAARVGDATRLARVSGVSVGQARRAIETGKRIAGVPRLAEAARQAVVSLEQADEIARTSTVAPGCVDDLLNLARNESYGVLKQKARTIRLEAQAGSDLTQRQHQARRLCHRVTDLGMIHLEADLEPHIGTPIVNRLEKQAKRLARKASHNNGNGAKEPFQRYLADALPHIVSDVHTSPGRRARSGSKQAHTGPAELVVLVSHEITQRGWHDVQPGEKCHIPGVGPIPPQTAKHIAQDAFLTGVFYDGADLRHLKRWTRHIPTPIRIALQLGEPPEFNGPQCAQCGNHYQLELDHHQPHHNGGPTSLPNIHPLCHHCHTRKTTQDRQDTKKQRHLATAQAQPPQSTASPTGLLCHQQPTFTPHRASPPSESLGWKGQTRGGGSENRSWGHRAM
jgi:5-methylcytosine-specific restriction endonuclease McrA